MFCQVQEYVHGMEKVSPNLQGKVDPGHPCRIFYTEDPCLQGLHAVDFPESRVRPTLRTNPTLCPFGRSLWIRILSSCFLAVGPGTSHCLWEPRFSSSANWGAHTFLAGFCEDELGPCGMPDVLRKWEYVCLLLALPGSMSPCFSPSPRTPQQGII